MIKTVLIGALAGILAGLIPGIHTNLAAVLVVSAGFDAWLSCVFLASLASSRSIIDAIPTVFLGASSDVMSLHPAHHFLQKGFGLVGVRILVSGALAGLIACIVLSPVIFLLLPLIQSAVKPVLFWLLLAIVSFLVLRDGVFAVFIFILSGILGLLSLSAVAEPLFPLLSGLFGASGLVLSLFERFEVPIQKLVSNPNLPYSRMSLFAFFGVCLSGLLMLFPGLGPSQAASLVRVKSKTRYLILTGALGTVDVILSLIAFVSIGRARNGAVAVMENLVGVFDLRALLARLLALVLSLRVLRGFFQFLFQGGILQFLSMWNILLSRSGCFCFFAFCRLSFQAHSGF